jgi:hypothetical protein
MYVYKEIEMEIPGISTLSTILKRPIELRSDALAQRREIEKYVPHC